MAEIRVNPTRMELKKLKGRLAVARRGHNLLKDKRDELMKQFIDVVRETKSLRERVEESLGKYNKSFAVHVPVFKYDLHGEKSSDGYNFGMDFTSGELDASIQELSDILDDMVKLAELEKTSQLLAQEIEKTRRRVNALEHVMIPQYENTIKSITMKLGENERGNITRLMKVKDMMLEEQLRKQSQYKTE